MKTDIQPYLAFSDRECTPLNFEFFASNAFFLATNFANGRKGMVIT